MIKSDDTNSIARRERIAPSLQWDATTTCTPCSHCLSDWLSDVVRRVTESPKQIRRLPSNFTSGIELGADLQRAAGDTPGTDEISPILWLHAPTGRSRLSELSHYGRRQNSQCRGGQRCRSWVARGDKTAHNQFRTNELDCICGDRLEQRHAPARRRLPACPRSPSLSVIAEVALISSSFEEPWTIN